MPWISLAAPLSSRATSCGWFAVMWAALLIVNNTWKADLRCNHVNGCIFIRR